MSEPVRNVLVVGGGTAGWMTASLLNRALGDAVHITLVESRAIGIIGVGESSVNVMRYLFDQLGVDEASWIQACHATYKLGLKMINWDGRGSSFYSTFESYPEVDGFNLAEWWLALRQGDESLGSACFVGPALCDSVLSPIYHDGTPFDESQQYAYAYHFDARLIADYLEGLSVSRGVEHVIADVVDVELDAAGAVKEIVLGNGERLSADLYVDCTGFRGRLINQALREPFQSYGQSLLCDSAVALQAPLLPGERIEPYTSATALSAGWVWKIPLVNRVGTGYVYSGQFLSKDEATAEFVAHLGESVPADPQFMHIKIRVGRNRSSWVKNCVAIGLSGGFVEPLESTGLFFSLYAIRLLIDRLKAGPIDAAAIESFNRRIGDCIDGVRDFLILHYYAAPRSDSSFWRAVTDDSVLTESLGERLQRWRTELPNADNINQRYHGFPFYSYVNLLTGLGHMPSRSASPLGRADSTNAEQAFREIKARTQHLASTLPTHEQRLEALYGTPLEATR